MYCICMMDMPTLFFLREGKKGLQSKQIKKVLQSNQDNKIRLDNKTTNNKKYSNLIDKCNKYRVSKYTMINLDKKDCINYNWYYQDKLNQQCIRVL